MNDSQPSKRVIFDEVAREYDRLRPSYPEAMVDDIIAYSDIPAGGSILEIGCGTGQATLPFARRGYTILCVELGKQLAQVAREKLASFPLARVVTGDFETISLQEDAFDLAISGTAFHWIDPAIGYPKIARALHPGGAIALFWNAHVHHDASAAFFEAVQEVYRREHFLDGLEDHEVYRQEAPELEDREQGWLPPRPEQASKAPKEAIDGSRLFGPVTVRRYLWEAVYSAREYVHLLDTYSDHHSLPAPARERLYRGITDLIESKFGGKITKGYLTMLFMARKQAGE